MASGVLRFCDDLPSAIRNSILIVALFPLTFVGGLGFYLIVTTQYANIPAALGDYSIGKLIILIFIIFMVLTVLFANTIFGYLSVKRIFDKDLDL